MRIERWGEAGPEWDAFVEAHPEAALGHAAAWGAVVRRAYRIEPHYLAARDGSGSLCGVLPLAEVRSLRGSLELVSMPFLDTGGILARDAETEAALLQAACELADRVRARALELRQRTPLKAAGRAGVLDRVDLVVRVSGSEDAQWRALPAKVRNQTRKAAREGLSLAPAHLDPARGFYRAFQINMRDLGSPVHARAFFTAAAEAFGDRLRFVVGVDGERPVGGLVAIDYAGVVSVPWASTLRAERHRCPNNLIYWEALRWAVERRAREFDFGRSPLGSGSHRFKRGWGAEERALHWVRFGRDGRLVPIASARDRSALARLSGLWARLPLPVANALGPRVRHHFSN